MKEIWKPIKGFEGYYEVSSLGRVRSLNRVVPVGRNERIVRGRVLKYLFDGNKYPQVSLKMLGRCYKRHVHRLVAETFIPNPSNLSDVNHKDMNKSNNNVDNLEWVSHALNMKMACASGKISRKSLMKPVDAFRNGKYIGSYHSMTAASRATGCSVSNISKITLKQQNQCKGFTFSLSRKG